MSLKCRFLDKNIAVEIMVVVLTLLSGLAITGENLIMFKLITVPQYMAASSNASINVTSIDEDDVAVVIENKHVMHILDQVFHFSSLGIAGLFFVEVFLKICTLQKSFISKPWQIFDTVVVLATLAMELTFHFVHFSEQAVYSVKYIVMLRLWRVPILCNISGNVAKTKKSTEQDTELYSYGKYKAEEKCIWLENTLSQQNETIIKMEGILQHLKSSKLNGVPGADDSAQTNGHVHHLSSITNDAFSSQRKSTLPDTIHILSKSQDVSPLELATQFQNISRTDKPGVYAKDRSYSEIKVQSNKVTENKISGFNNKLYKINSSKSDQDYVDGADIDQIETKNVILPPAKTSSNVLLTSSQHCRVISKSRKRRFSTSEIVDYNSLGSKNINSTLKKDSNKYASAPSLDFDNDNKICAKNVLERSFENANSEDTDKVTNLEKKCEVTRHSEKNSQRRYSCPEYVFTQRMSLTNDESILIGDDHSVHDVTAYDNLGFDCDDDLTLEVLAEFDGTKTYRSEGGIPMTSL